MNDPSGTWFWAVWAPSATEAWAVGWNNTIMHWDGAAWSRVTSPFSDNQDFLRGVWGTGACDVWVVGTYSGAAHYDCQSWTVAPKSTAASGGAVWGTGSGDIWAAGAWSGIAHWNGSAWSTYPISAELETMSVWGAATSNVWATTYQGSPYHFDGTSWTTSAVPTTGPVNAFWGTNSSSMWAVGGLLNHWDGAAWAPYAPKTVGDNDADTTLMAVHAWAPDDVWSVGYAGKIIHYDGKSWSQADNGGAGTALLRAIWGSAADDQWVVGDDTVLHWDGVAWTFTHQFAFMRAVSGTSASDVWTAGEGQQLAHFDGQAWTAISPPFPTQALDFEAIWASASDDVWFAADQGMVHWDGATFTVDSTVKGALALWGSASDDVWAVGPSVLAHWDGTSWASSTLIGNWNAISGHSKSDIWAVADGALPITTARIGP